MKYKELHSTLDQLKAEALETFEGIASAKIRTTGPGFYSLIIKTNSECEAWIELSVNDFSHSTGYRNPWASFTGNRTSSREAAETIKHFKTYLDKIGLKSIAA